MSSIGQKQEPQVFVPAADNVRYPITKRGNIMSTSIRLLGLSLTMIGLSSCMIDGTNPVYDQGAYDNQKPLLYPDSYESTVSYETPNAQTNVQVPETYYVGAHHAPAAAKDADSAWVASQSPQAYTIEVAQDEKAARVAGVLQKTPKNEHMAEVKYKQNGQVYYKGLYGSYNSQEAAQEALNGLPDDVKQHSGIKTWSSIQNHLSE
jgi:septal ring-binding cell division protein DamX